MFNKEEVLNKMTQDMHLRGFAASTRNNYLRYAGFYLACVEEVGAELCEASIRTFLTYLLDERKLMPGSVNMYNAAIRFLFDVTLERPIIYRQLPRLRERKGLPEILSKEEICRIFEHTTPLRNRAMLMTIYGGGLRISEACELKVSDIDSKSMRIFIRNGKGSKDRFTLLSQSNLEVLREYFKTYRPRHPDGWLFLNKAGNNHAQKRTLQVGFDRAIERAGITKHVTVHTLRASFATHLLEDGVDIFSVKRL